MQVKLPLPIIVEFHKCLEEKWNRFNWLMFATELDLYLGPASELWSTDGVESILGSKDGEDD